MKANIFKIIIYNINLQSESHIDVWIDIELTLKQNLTWYYYTDLDSLVFAFIYNLQSYLAIYIFWFCFCHFDKLIWIRHKLQHIVYYRIIYFLD